ADQIRIFAHQLQRLGARRRILLHAALAVQIVACVEEFFVVALADQLVQLGHRQSLVQIDFLKFRALFAKQTLRFAASGSSGFQIKFHHNHFRSADRSPVRCRKSGSSARNSWPSNWITPSLFSAVMSPCHTSFPGRVMMATSWHRRSTVSNTWLVMNTVRPWSVKRRSHCFISDTPAGSIDSNGSSRKRIS